MSFRKDFVWGAATASYQVEGAAYEDGKGLNIWDVFCKEDGHVYEHHTGDVACDQYHRYKEDVAIMKELGLKCNFVFQEKFGAGEPSEAMIQTMYDAIPYDSYDRVIAVGGGAIMDLCKLLEVNDSATNMVHAVANLELVLKEKLEFIANNLYYPSTGNCTTTES